MLPGRLRRLEIALRSLCERDDATRWAQWFAPFTPAEKGELTASVCTTVNPTRSIIEGVPPCSRLDRMLYADCKLWLPENLLERGDRMTMAASVEGRVPFLDHELVEFAFRVPNRLKVRGFNRKWLVKAVARKYLPDRIIDRRKVGFEVPLAQWFRGKLRDMCYDRICTRNGLVGEIFAGNELKRILDDHCSARKDNFLKIWTLLGISIWHDQFCRSRGTNQGGAKCNEAVPVETKE
jgi:asparagine synthase (glutamine-hydrolysing)